MKKLTTSILFCLISIHLLSAQKWNSRQYYHDDNTLSFGVGLNVIYDAGGVKGLSNINEALNFGNPIYLSAEYYRNNKFSFISTVSFNKYKDGKIIDGVTILKNHEASYIAIDLAGKHSFRELLDSHAFEPYMFLGVGFTHIGDYKSKENDQIIKAKGKMTFNTGFGINYWLSMYWAININAVGKFDLGGGVSNQAQSSLGVIFKIPK
jgi:hypothetical protein